MAPFASVNVVPAGHLSQRRGVASTTRVSGTGVDAECVVMKDTLSDVATVLGRKQLQTNSRVHRGREDGVITARHTCTVSARDSIEQQQRRQWHTPDSTVEVKVEDFPEVALRQTDWMRGRFEGPTLWNRIT